MAWAGVADFDRDLDLAAQSFADQLLGARDALTGHELQRSHAGGLLEDMESARSSVPARASIEISGVALLPLGDGGDPAARCGLRLAAGSAARCGSDQDNFLI